MQRASTALVSSARRVQQQFDGGLELALVQAVDSWQNGGPGARDRLGDPHAIVLESELVVALAARLRAAPWAEVGCTTSGAADSSASHAERTLDAAHRRAHEGRAALRQRPLHAAAARISAQAPSLRRPGQPRLSAAGLIRVAHPVTAGECALSFACCSRAHSELNLPCTHTPRPSCMRMVTS